MVIMVMVVVITISMLTMVMMRTMAISLNDDDYGDNGDDNGNIDDQGEKV